MIHHQCNRTPVLHTILADFSVQGAIESRNNKLKENTEITIGIFCYWLVVARIKNEPTIVLRVKIDYYVGRKKHTF